MVITLKSKFKRFIYLSICLSILLFTLPFSSSALVTKTIQVNFAMDDQYIDNEDAKLDFARLEIEYLDTQSNERYPSFGGQAFSVQAGFDPDFSWTVRIYNYSWWEYSFELVIPGQAILGIETVPAYDGSNPGVYTLDLRDVYALRPNASAVTLWFHSAHQPVWRGPRLNTSYSLIEYSTPYGVFRTDTIYAPNDTYGDYVYTMQELVNDDVIARIPDYYDGYKIDYNTLPLDVVVDQDSVNRYLVEYNSDTRFITVNFYDQNDNFIRSINYSLGLNDSIFTLPQDQEYVFAPLKLDVSNSSQLTFKVYQVDFSGQREDAYQDGLLAGLAQSNQDISSRLEQSYNDGYSSGFTAGYADGSVLTGMERAELSKEYNVFTGFFDGIFRGLFNSIDFVFDGIGFGGVTLGTVVWTLVIVFVIVKIGSVVL